MKTKFLTVVLAFLAACVVAQPVPPSVPIMTDAEVIIPSWKNIHFDWDQPTNTADGVVFYFGPTDTNGVPNYTTRIEIPGVTNTTATVNNVYPGKYAAGLTLYIEQPESSASNAPLIRVEGNMGPQAAFEIPNLPSTAPHVRQYLLTRMVFQSRTNITAPWVTTGTSAPVVINTDAHDSEFFRMELITEQIPAINQ